MEFTDEEILLLHELDFDPAPSFRSRVTTLLWWLGLAVGCVLATATLLAADLGSLRRYGG